jgi:hypothetical protein
MCCNPDIHEEMVAAVRALLADEPRRMAMEKSARTAAPGYDRVYEAEKFEQIVEGIFPAKDV